MFTVHWKAGFFNADGGWEYNLSIIAVAVAVTIAGPGDASLDAAMDLATDWTGATWGAAVLVLGLLAGIVNQVTRQGSAPEEGAPADPTAAG